MGKRKFAGTVGSGLRWTTPRRYDRGAAEYELATEWTSTTRWDPRAGGGPDRVRRRRHGPARDFARRPSWPPSVVIGPGFGYSLSRAASAVTSSSDASRIAVLCPAADGRPSAWLSSGVAGSGPIRPQSCASGAANELLTSTLF